jgi:2-polyprenyl-3-methyl-5-hydroxy-6-metoxy-1,4-benzoquinol methylase
MDKNQADASLRSLYEQNWERMNGLQMSHTVAKKGYEIVSTINTGNALDIGCGDGTNLLELIKMGFKSQGCDISENAVKKAQKKGLKASRVDTNQLPLPYKDGEFDLVWLSDVIEHVFWPDSLVSEINRILRPNGYLFVSTPNVSWWGIRLQILLGKTLRNIHPEHIWWFNWIDLKKILKSNNFLIKQAYGYNCLAPHPLVNKYSFLSKLNFMGSVNPLFTYTFAVLAQKS